MDFLDYISSDATFANEMLTHAKQIYQFAKQHPGFYSTSVNAAAAFYKFCIVLSATTAVIRLLNDYIAMLLYYYCTLLLSHYMIVVLLLQSYTCISTCFLFLM